MGKYHPMSKIVLELGICLGSVFKVNKKNGRVETSDAIVLSLPISIMSSSGKYGNRIVEVSTTDKLSSVQRRYKPDEMNDPYVSVRMLSSDKDLLFRRVEVCALLHTYIRLPTHPCTHSPPSRSL